MQLNKQDLINLISIEKLLYEVIEEISFEYKYFVGDFELSDFILDKFGFPPDTTIELGLEKGFCRDYLIDIIWDKNNYSSDIYRKLIREYKNLEADPDFASLLVDSSTKSKAEVA